MFRAGLALRRCQIVGLAEIGGRVPRGIFYRNKHTLGFLDSDEKLQSLYNQSPPEGSRRTPRTSIQEGDEETAKSPEKKLAAEKLVNAMQNLEAASTEYVSSSTREGGPRRSSVPPRPGSRTRLRSRTPDDKSRGDRSGRSGGSYKDRERRSARDNRGTRRESRDFRGRDRNDRDGSGRGGTRRSRGPSNFVMDGPRSGLTHPIKAFVDRSFVDDKGNITRWRGRFIETPCKHAHYHLPWLSANSASVPVAGTGSDQGAETEEAKSGGWDFTRAKPYFDIMQLSESYFAGLSQLNQKFGMGFESPQLMAQAFMYPSYAYHHIGNKQGKETNGYTSRQYANEGLEWIGDVVVNMCVSSMVFQSYPDLSTGDATIFRQSLVSNEALAHVGEVFELHKHFRIVEAMPHDNPDHPHTKLRIARTFEGLVGALYVDRGLFHTSNWLSEYCIPFMVHMALTGEKANMSIVNPGRGPKAQERLNKVYTWGSIEYTDMEMEEGMSSVEVRLRHRDSGAEDPPEYFAQAYGASRDAALEIAAGKALDQILTKRIVEKDRVPTWFELKESATSR